MAAEDQASGVPPVQYVRVSNIAWMNCTTIIDYGRDPTTGDFKQNKSFGYLLKDQTSWIDLSTLDGIKPQDVVRLRIDAVQGKTGEAIRYNPNKQTAHYQFSGTLFAAWLSKS